MAIPVIEKGDTSKEITLALADGYPFDGCTLHVGFCGVERTFENLTAGGTVTLSFSADETARFPLGTSLVTLSLRNAAGSVRSLPFAKIKVSDSPSEVYDAAITIDPGTLNIEELPTRFNDEDVRDRVNAVISWMRRVVPMLALCALPAFGDGLTVYTAPKGRVYNDENIVTNVVLDLSSGNAQLVETIRAEAPAPGDYSTVSNRAMSAVQTETDPTVPSWAKVATPPYLTSYTESDPTVPNWAKASSKPSYDFAEILQNFTTLWIGSQGNAGKVLKFLAYGTNPTVGGIQIAWSTMSDDNLTSYFYNGVSAKRNGVTEDYLWDSTSNGVARLKDIPTVYAWAKASTKPSYSWSEITSKPSFKTVATSGAYSDLTGKPNLATVATSGSYNDLSNKPTIPTVPTSVSAFANDADYVDATALASATNSLAATIPEPDALATNLVQTVINSSLFNLTYDEQLQVTWQKVAEGGAFYEKCYTNINMIGVSP